MSVAVEHRGHVTELRLDRPDAANAINLATVGELTAAIEAFAADDTARVLVITGAGERSFCAGGDLGDMLEFTRHADTDRAGPLGFARLDPGKPTIAAVNGHCFGGGLELALWCDFRIAADNASFGALNRPWGLPLIDGGTQRLPRIVGHANAMWMIGTGVRVDAQQALRIGLVQEVVSRGQAAARAGEIADQVAAFPQPGLVADRRAVMASLDRPLASGLDFEAVVGRAVLADPDVIARLQEHRRRDG